MKKVPSHFIKHTPLISKESTYAKILLRITLMNCYLSVKTFSFRIFYNHRSTSTQNRRNLTSFLMLIARPLFSLASADPNKYVESMGPWTKPDESSLKNSKFQAKLNSNSILFVVLIRFELLAPDGAVTANGRRRQPPMQQLSSAKIQIWKF